MFKEELRHDYPLTEDSEVFDIGAYKGEWAQIIHDKYKCRVLCFEPVFELVGCFDICSIGLGGYNRNETILVDNDKTGVICKTGEEQIIQIRDIMDVIKAMDLQHIDLMKINIEGMEYELLERLIETDWIRNITDIQVQFHRMEGSDERMWKIQNELKKTHEPTYRYRYVWENWRLK